MTTAYTSLLGLALPVTGELSGTWGDTVNNSITSLLDSAIAGTTTITADTTLSTTTGAANQSRQAILLCSPASANITITAPAQSKIYTVINTSATYTVKIVGVGPTTGVTLAVSESAVVAWNGSDFIRISSNSATTGNFTVNGNLSVTGNTTLGDATTDTVTVNGYMSVGGAVSPAYNLLLRGDVTSGANQYGLGSTSTLSGTTFSASVLTQSILKASTAYTAIAGVRVTDFTTASGATVGTQHGIRIEDQTLGTNIYGITSLVSSGTNKYNIYASGTANNYLAGSLGIGSTSLTGVSLAVSKLITGATVSYGVLNNGTIQQDVTSSGIGYATSLASNAAAFTLNEIRHYDTTQATIGAGSIVSNQYAFIARSTLTGATTNYGFTGNLTAPTSGIATTGTITSISSSTTTVTINHNAITYTNGQVVTISATANATALTSGATCTILTVGTTDFTLIGAASNTVGVSFTATGAGTGTGTVTLNVQGSGKTVAGAASGSFTYTTTTSQTFAAVTVLTGSVTVSTRYNLYMAGTADNYIAGNLGIGINPPAAALDVSGAPAGALSRFANTTAPTLDNSTHAGESIFLRSGGTAGLGNVQAVLAFGKADGSSLRTGSAIASIQNTADADQVGIGFYTSPGTGSTQTLTQQMLLDYAGNLGLGVTPSAWGSAYKMFQASSQASFGGNSSNITIVGSNYYNDGASKYIGTGLAALYLQDAGVHKWYNAPSGTAGTAITFTQAMTLDASGNLYLGATSGARGSTNTRQLVKMGTSAGYFEVQALDTSSSVGMLFSDGSGGNYGLIDYLTTDNMVFYTASTERARIDSSGRVAIGATAFNSAITGTSLLQVNSDALINSLTVGRGAGAVSSNSAFGNSALVSNTTGAFNSAFGQSALALNIAATRNSAFGYASLQVNDTGGYNSAFGMASMQTNSSGSFNTAMGVSALNSNTTSSNNTAVGYQAGYSQTTGGSNTAIGRQALFTSTGSENTAVGDVALYANTTGSFNVGLGRFALYSNTTASNNVAVGYQAGYTNTTSAGNTLIGHQAGYTQNNTSGNAYNTFIGYQAGYGVTTGYGNVFIGVNAGTAAGSGSAVTTGSKNTIIGAYTGNQGGLDIRTASNWIVLSDGDGNPRQVIDSSGNVNAASNMTVGSLTATAPLVGTGRYLTLYNTSNATLSIQAVDGTNDRNAVLELLSSGNGISYSQIIYGDTDTTPATPSPLLFQGYHSGTVTERMRLTATGNLGLGVTPSAWSGQTALQTNGGSLATSGTNTLNLAQNAYYNGGWLRVNALAASMFQQSGGAFNFFTAGSSTAGSAITFTQAMTLDASGNLGIGTTSPSSKFVVSNAGAAGLEIAPTGFSSAPSIVSYNRSGAAYTQLTLDASVNVFAISGTEKARIDTVGNVQVQAGAVMPYAPAPASISTTATLTNANIQAQIINTTGTTYTVTMPLGTTLETLATWATTNVAYDFFVINTASGTITMAVNTGVTSLGGLTIATGVSAQFRIRRTAANTFVLYRLG